MTTTPPSPHALRVADLNPKRAHALALRPDAAHCAKIAAALGLDGLRKLRLEGNLRAQGKADWRLEAHLGATIEQPCAVTLAPVVTRIEADVTRYFLHDFTDPDLPEAEMTADADSDPLGDWIDLEAVLIEALSLEIPPYPRARDVDFDGHVHAAAGVDPLTDEAAKPFASLHVLRDKLKDGD